MKRNLILSISSGLALLVGATAAQAVAVVEPAPAGPAARIQARQAAQADRIASGTASGAITAKEATHLGKQQERVEKLVDKTAAGGVTAKEAAAVDKAQDHASHAIRRAKHDKDGTRPVAPPVEKPAKK